MGHVKWPSICCYRACMPSMHCTCPKGNSNAEMEQVQFTNFEVEGGKPHSILVAFIYKLTQCKIGQLVHIIKEREEKILH